MTRSTVTDSLTDWASTRPFTSVTVTEPSTDCTETLPSPPFTVTSPRTVSPCTVHLQPSTVRSVSTPESSIAIQAGMVISMSALPAGPHLPLVSTEIVDPSALMSRWSFRRVSAWMRTASRLQVLTVIEPA